MALEDKIVNALTGSNIKTIRVSAVQLADVIYNCFVLNQGNNPDNIAKLLKGKIFSYTEVDSPDGKYHLHISHFRRGITVHRVAWVKKYETGEIFEWKGYTLGPLKRAFENQIATGRIVSFKGTGEADNTDSLSQFTEPPIPPVPKRNRGIGRTVIIITIIVLLAVGGYRYLDQTNILNKFLSKDLSQYIGMNYNSVLRELDLPDDAYAMFEKGNILLIDADKDGRIEGVACGNEGKYNIYGLFCGDKNIDLPNDFFMLGQTQSFDHETKQIFYGSEVRGQIIRLILKDNVIDQINLSVEEDMRMSTPTPTSTPEPTPTPNTTREWMNRPLDGNQYVYDDDDDDDYYYDDDSYDEDSDDDTSGYILPNSDSEKLTKSDLEGLSKDELRIARNEIYARHGRRFLDAELQAYFDSQDWYYGSIDPEDFVDSQELSALERRNAKFIKKYE